MSLPHRKKMLIPKNVQRIEIENPLRPKIGIPQDKSICKLSWAPFEIEEGEIEERIRVDASHIDEFVEELEALIPKSDRYRCNNHEVWLVTKEWKKDLVALVKKHFEVVILELRKWD